MWITLLMIIAMGAFAWSIYYLRDMYYQQKAERTKVCHKCLHVGYLHTFKPETNRKDGFEMTTYVCPHCGNVESGFTTY